MPLIWLIAMAGRQVTYEEVQQEFLSMYPSFTTSEFRHAAKSAITINVKAPSYFAGMTKLETQTRALVDSYLDTAPMRQAGIEPEVELNGTQDKLVVTDLLQNFAMPRRIETRDKKLIDTTNVNLGVKSVRYEPWGQMMMNPTNRTSMKTPSTRRRMTYMAVTVLTNQNQTRLMDDSKQKKWSK